MINISNYPCPPFKIIILDEADTMTHDAQSALRRVMENYSSVTRFCLICNYVTRIIEPLSSRCAKFNFKPLPLESMRGRLNYILQQEFGGYDNEKSQDIIGDNELNMLLDLSEGDMRRAVTFLQTTSQFFGPDSNDNNNNSSSSSSSSNDNSSSYSGLTADELRELAGVCFLFFFLFHVVFTFLSFCHFFYFFHSYSYHPFL